MGCSLSLRDATEADRPYLLHLFSSLRVQQWGMAAAAGGLQPLLDLQYQAQERAYRGQFPGSCCQLILDAGAPVGRLWVDRSGTDIRVLDLGIEPALQGRGIGRRVIGALLDEAQFKAGSVSLAVAQDNRAGVLYRRLGFDVIGEHPPYLEMRWRAASSLPVSGGMQ